MLAVEQAEQWFRWEWFFLPFYEIQAILTRLTCVGVTLVIYHLVIPTLCDTRDRSPPGSSVRGILQVRIPEWVAVPFSRGSSWPSEWTRVFCIAGRFFTTSATEVFSLSFKFVCSLSNKLNSDSDGNDPSYHFMKFSPFWLIGQLPEKKLFNRSPHQTVWKSLKKWKLRGKKKTPSKNSITFWYHQ